MIDLTKYDFDDVCYYVADMVGDSFVKTMQIAEDIAENPSRYVGLQALTAAKKLAAYKVRLAPFEAYMKKKAPATKSPSDLLIKEAVIVLSHNIDELINVMKLAAREL